MAILWKKHLWWQACPKGSQWLPHLSGTLKWAWRDKGHFRSARSPSLYKAVDCLQEAVQNRNQSAKLIRTCGDFLSWDVASVFVRGKESHCTHSVRTTWSVSHIRVTRCGWPPLPPLYIEWECIFPSSWMLAICSINMKNLAGKLRWCQHEIRVSNMEPHNQLSGLELLITGADQHDMAGVLRLTATICLLSFKVCHLYT